MTTTLQKQESFERRTKHSQFEKTVFERVVIVLLLDGAGRHIMFQL